MATIRDFRKSVSDMEEDELLNHIRDIRALRRMMPERKVAKSKKTAKSKSKSDVVKDYMEGLDEADKKALLEKLISMKGGG